MSKPVAKLRDLYARILKQAPLPSTRDDNGAALARLQEEWVRWLNAYGVAIGDDNIDVAVAVAAGIAKTIIETFEDADLKNLATARLAVKAANEATLLHVAILASMRKEPIE